MPGSARKPSGTAEKPRQRTLSQVVVRCEIGECPFQAKTTRTVVKHQREAHGIDPKPEDTFDSSVNISVLDDTTFPTANGAAAGDSLDHKSKSDFYQEVSRVQQSTQLETGEKRDRSSDEEEDEEDEERIKLSSTAVTEQSQGEIRRQAVSDRALAIAGNNQREAHDTSENLLESEGQVETGDLFASSDSMLMKTAQETHNHSDYNYNYNYGRGRMGNSCRFKHDLAAKQKYHEDEEKRKKEDKEKEQEEEQKRKEEETKKKEEKKDEEAKETAKKRKARRKSKKEKKTEESTPMDVDNVDDDSLDDSESNPRKKAKPQPKGETSKSQKLPTNMKEAKVTPTASGQTPQGQTQTPSNLNLNPQPQPPQTRPQQSLQPSSLLTPGQIIAAQKDSQGSTDISQLVTQEAALKQCLYEQYED